MIFDINREKIKVNRAFAETLNKTKDAFLALNAALKVSAQSMITFAVDKLVQDSELMRLAGIQPTTRYKLCGSPYGKNSKGKKRWLLEQKRKTTIPAAQ